MPKTFREAVEITRGIGLQYLWIDSLCILQDSADDWNAESTKMGRIYRGASITIFAAAAEGKRLGGLTWLLLDLGIEGHSRELLRGLCRWAEVNLEQIFGHIETSQTACMQVVGKLRIAQDLSRLKCRSLPASMMHAWHLC